MKLYAAALLACAAAAINLSAIKEDTRAKYGFDAPAKCPPMPEELPTVAEVFKAIDQDNSGSISPKEGFDALYCAKGWGLISEDEGVQAFNFFKNQAGDAKLDLAKF